MRTNNSKNIEIFKRIAAADQPDKPSVKFPEKKRDSLSAAIRTKKDAAQFLADLKTAAASAKHRDRS